MTSTNRPENCIHIEQGKIHIEGCIIIGNPKGAMIYLNDLARECVIMHNTIILDDETWQAPQWWQLSRWWKLIKAIKRYFPRRNTTIGA